MFRFGHSVHQTHAKALLEEPRAGGGGGPPPPQSAASAATANAKRSTKRKNSKIQPPPVSTPPIIRKRTRSSTNNSRKPSVDFDMDDDDDDGADGGSDLGKPAPLLSTNGKIKKPETKEKRKNFWERNRQATLKCRQRKKEWLQKLQANVEKLTTENERLTSALAASQAEISRHCWSSGSRSGCGPGGVAGGEGREKQQAPAQARQRASSGGYGY